MDAGGTVWARSWCRPPSAGCGSMCPTSAWRNSPGRNAGYDETDPRQGQCNRSRGSLHLHSQLSYTGLATFGRLRSKPLITKETWNKIRDILIKEDVPLLSLAKLEHEYVDIILNKDANFHNFPSSSNDIKLTQDVRAIIQSLVAGLILSI